MRVLQGERTTGERVVALGTFDGVHLGHQKLFRTGRAMARELGVPLQVCTFDRHPLRVIRPEAAPGLLTTVPEKLRKILACSVDEVRLLHFDRDMADISPEAFLEKLRGMTEVRGVIAGWNYTFGRGGHGNADLLREDGKRNGYRVRILEPVKTAGGIIVSSSEVRKQLLAGKLKTAERLLGAPYRLNGLIVNGKHVGRTLGFPTANVKASPEKQLPAFGVYLCLLETREKAYRGIANIGMQPTIPSGEASTEVHLLDGAPDLYGERARVTLMEYMREERRFPSPEELQAQIARDRDAALRAFKMA